ncbi:MAG TPA: hypothetical protein VF116_07005 [Ktedonobacterales bacterium]
MSDSFGLAFNAAVFGIGSLAAGYMLWQGNTYVRQAGTMPRRAARAWKWRIVFGLCGSIAAFCFGCNGLLLHHVPLEWVVIAGSLATGGVAVSLFMIHNPESYGRSPPREPDDHPAGDDLPLRPQQPPDRD